MIDDYNFLSKFVIPMLWGIWLIELVASSIYVKFHYVPCVHKNHFRSYISKTISGAGENRVEAKSLFCLTGNKRYFV